MSLLNNFARQTMTARRFQSAETIRNNLASHDTERASLPEMHLPFKAIGSSETLLLAKS